MEFDHHANLAEYIEYYANRSGYNYRDIAILAGFSSADALYMLMRGEVKVPIDIIPQLAGALGCNASEMLMLKLQEVFKPELFDLLKESFEVKIPPKNEVEWLAYIRDYFHGPLPALNVKMMQSLERTIPAAYPDNVTSTAERVLRQEGRSVQQ